MELILVLSIGVLLNWVVGTPKIRDRYPYIWRKVPLHLEVPLEFGVGSPKRRKKNFFALKHLTDPTYEIKTRTEGPLNLPQIQRHIIIICRDANQVQFLTLTLSSS